MATVLIADKFSKGGIEAMRGMGLEVLERPEVGDKGLPKALIETGASVLIVRSTKVTAEAIKGAPALQLIVRAGAGYDTIDVNAASSVGVYVSNCPGKNAAAVAELTWALILGLDRRLPESDRQLKEGRWNKKEFGKAGGLLGRTLGIIGVGTIGRLVIERGKA
ncbi:MAG: hydroxyacid dehydrogenase, partial [Planctomycetota bacterium]|nr:hydroxyacid dehydrogenase [Planctomycetota bacterium]